MPHSSNDILRKRSETTKEIEPSKSLQNEQPPKSNQQNTFNASNHVVQAKFIIVKPTRKDILCGRGKSFINHEGNRRFRDVISKHKYAYSKGSQRSKRSQVVRAVVIEILRTGARFLKKPQNKLEWYDGGVSVAKEKVGLLI
jgi:hypothetical protein